MQGLLMENGILGGIVGMGSILLFCLAVGAIVTMLVFAPLSGGRRDRCAAYGEELGITARYVDGAGCFVRTGGAWVQVVR